MTSDDSCVKVFVFVARDAAEYNKYVLMRCENDEHGKNVEENNAPSGFIWRFDATSKILRLVINKGSLGPDGWKRLRPPEVASDFKDVNRIAVLLERLRNECCDDETKTQAKVFTKDVFLGNSKNGGELRGGLWTVLQGLRDGDGKSVLTESVQGRIFIHWGGGERDSALFYERKVTEFLPPDWRLYSLGTNRNDLFPVDGEAIHVPCALVELQKLEKKFSGGSDLEHIKEILTDYVVANEECRSLAKRAKSKPKRAKPKLNGYDFTAEQCENLKSFFMSFAVSHDNPLMVRLFANCEALQEFLRGNKTKLPFCEEVVELFSSLLREGICHE